jgi:DNA-binding SARP family transcriptional activator/tetratricopeptide (TPR) repeat protein
LGDIEVSLGGRRAKLPASKKTRALLGYLVVTGSPHLRDHLCDLLWQGPDDPRGALRWSLTKLRAVLDSDRINADRERVSFEAEGVQSDVGAIRQALAGGVRDAPTEVLCEVSARFRGELLEGLDLPDCYGYHEWCVSQREGFRRLRVEVLASLVERYSLEPEAALGYARQRLAIDPIAEGAHVAVIKLLTTLGRNREANEKVDACRRILARELGTKPSAALLLARVRSEPSETVAPVLDAPSFPGVVVPFVGRETERLALGAAWGAALDGRGDGLVLVSGEPGIGKTRLADELALRAHREGARVMRGRAFEAEMVRPHGPWIDALRSTPLGDEVRAFAAHLAPILPELGEANAPAVDRARIFDGVTGLLGALGARAGCLVVLDDLQWFDEASIALLHFAIRAVTRSRVLLACTAREDELHANPPAIRLVRALQRERRLVEIALGPLDPSATSLLARSVDAAADGERVAAESAGNPLFALELARAEATDGRITASLDALLADRLDRLDARSQDVLPWAAALGRGFPFDLLARVTELGHGDLLDALDALERRGVLRSQPLAAGSGYDFAHDLVRGAAYRRLSTPRRRFVHQRIARALAELATSDLALHGDVAHHAALAGDHDLVAHASVAAAERCLRMFAFDEAARLAETGIVHADRLSGGARIATRLALLNVKVSSGRWLRRASELAKELLCAVVEASDAGMNGEAALGLHHLSMLQRDQGDLLGAHDSTLRAAELSRGCDPVTRGRQLAHTARCLALMDSEMHQANGMIDEASGLLPDHEEDFDWLSAHALERCYHGAADSEALLERALGLARRKEDGFGETECLIGLVQLALDKSNPTRALAWCRELAPVAAKMSEGSEGAVADGLEALARVASCVPGADDHLDRAIARLREIDAKGMLAYVLSSAAGLDLAAGRIDRAEARAAEALRAAQAIRRATLVAIARASLAEIALACGDPARAAAHLDAVSLDPAQPFAISARARACVERATERLRA